MPYRICVATAITFLLTASMTYAQSSNSSALNLAAPVSPFQNSGYLEPGADPKNSLSPRLFGRFVDDQKQFWTAPLRMKRSDAQTVIPFLGITGGLMASDTWISDHVPDAPSQLNRSQNISNYAVYSLIGVTGGSYLFGHFTHNDHLRETGFLAGEAAANSTVVSYFLKFATQRPRPLEPDAGSFFHGGSSFPSEHAAIAWSVASIVAHEYPGPLTKVLAYGLASTVTITRVTGKQHFSSDVFIGSALGWYFGRQIYRAHHDPELGGTAWGDLTEEAPAEKMPRTPEHMGSPYVPLDSWVYPALDRLTALGLVKTSFLGQKPWTRVECANQVVEARELIELHSEKASAAVELIHPLENEFVYELGLLDGKPNRTAEIESVYARTMSISGPALTDGYHFGQTISNDFGRPFRQGTNGQAGASVWAATGPFTIYVRGEFQHAPSAPPLSDAARQVIAERDSVPLPPATPFDTINRPRLLDAYAAFNLKGWQISAGKESLDWAPGSEGSMLWSQNIEPITMVRLMPPVFRFPLLGEMRVDSFFGRLDGHSFVPHPYIYGQKINLKPLSCLELGFGRTVTIGGEGGDPLNFHNFVYGLFGISDSTNSVPGDSHSSMDWVFRIPKLHNYLTFYGELYADDDPVPLKNPPKNPYRPGIYLTRFPRIPKLDLHIEAASTESPGFFNFGSTNHGNLNYWNQTYRDGYTNNGNVIGNSVGRMGRTIQGWFTYWMSPSTTLQLGYKHNMVSRDFIPGGGYWQDYQFRYDTYLKSGFYLKNMVQFENISRYPLLYDGPRHNLSATIEFGWTPRRH